MNRVFAIVFVAHTLFGQTKTLVSGQTMQLTAPAVTWSVTPPVGTVSGTGLYTAPATNPTQQSVVVSAIAGSDTIVSQSITLLADTITLPIEVVGPDGTSSVVNFGVQATAALSGSLNLSLQVHNLKYETMMSVRINQGAWTAVNTSTAALEPLAVTYGGIGGGFSTIKLTMPLPGTLTPGSNQIAFRFNGTDGRSSGFRVLAFNISNSAGNLIPAANFVWDDPTKWAAPLIGASDIAAGKAAFQAEGTLRTQLSGPTTNIKASCGDCHAQDGRDLKYFNYSNASIEARSVFHGLTAQQGAQIASYIRSLATPSPGRPWNPPYQPGPGTDAKPVYEWAAGAGIDAVLGTDAAMLPYLAPGGSYAGWAATAVLSPREIPITLQLPDWNSWLPQVHPLDYFGAPFSSSTCPSIYKTLATTLLPNDAGSYKKNLLNITNFLGCDSSYMLPLQSIANASWTAAMRSGTYSDMQWKMVKDWEINQQFGLEGMPQVPFGTKADRQGWWGKFAFYTAPNAQHVFDGPGILNGTYIAWSYLSNAWYHLQLILNAGQGQEAGNSPIDFPYIYRFVEELSWIPVFDRTGKLLTDPATAIPHSTYMMFWMIKTLQEETQPGTGPELGELGFQGKYVNLNTLVSYYYAPLWRATSASVRVQLMTAYLKSWFAQVSTYTPQQWYAKGQAVATDDPRSLDHGTVFGGQIWSSLPRLRALGVDPALLQQISAWAAKIWPVGNWTLNNSATCTIYSNPLLGVNKCTSD